MFKKHTGIHKNSFKLILICSVFMIFCGCTKSISEIDKLPPITQSGEGSFGCLINGKLCVPSSGKPNSVANAVIVNFYNTPIPATSQILIRYNNGASYMIFNLDSLAKFNNYPINNATNKNIQILMRGASNGTSCYNIGTSYYYTKMTGEVKITKLDLTNKIIAGVFSFSIEANGCENFNVTDGRFDLPF